MGEWSGYTDGAWEVILMSAAGAVMAGRKKDGQVRVEFVAPPEWVRRLEANAARFGVSVSAYLRLAATERMERDEATAPPPPARPEGKGRKGGGQ